MNAPARVLLTACATGILISRILHGVATANIVHVPGDSATIQSGIDGAASGDTVLVSDGTYSGAGNWDIDFGGKDVVVQSEHGFLGTIIDCADAGGSHRAFILQNGEGTQAEINGFTLIHAGTPGTDGGAIYCLNASPTIRNNLISDNRTFGLSGGLYSGRGGGIYCQSSSAAILDNIIRHNSSQSGGGIYGYLSTVTIERNTLDSNSGGGIVCYASEPLIRDNLIRGTTGGDEQATMALGLVNSAARIIGNRIEGNQAGISIFVGSGDGSGSYPRAQIEWNTIVENYGDGVSCGASGPTSHDSVQALLINNTVAYNGHSGIGLSDFNVEIENSLVAFNGTVDLAKPGIRCTLDTTVRIALSCSNVFGNAGGDWVGCIADQAGSGGNFSADPAFCDPPGGDFRVSGSSACLPQANSCCALVGAMAAGCDLVSLPGDVNCDGRLDLSDVVRLGNALDGLLDLAGTCGEDMADVDQNGMVDEDDYALLYDAVAGEGP